MNNYSLDDLDVAKNYFDKAGFVNFSSIIPELELEKLDYTVSALVKQGRLIVGETQLLSNNDIIYLDEFLEQLCRHRSIVQIAQFLLGRSVELQHAKYNAKPKAPGVLGGEVLWHQDYPFFPHSNFDLIAAVIHLDDEDFSSGSMEYILSSHLDGVRDHTNGDGSFVYYCTDLPYIERSKIFSPIFKRGDISFHHALTLHRSGIKTNDLERRLIVFQYRAVDAVQLAGVVWRCNGYKVSQSVDEQREKFARFPSGESVSLRGKNGRLIDMCGKFRKD